MDLPKHYADEADFTRYNWGFKGASKRLEKIMKGKVVTEDFNTHLRSSEGYN
jgi:hypothetical protein